MDPAAYCRALEAHLCRKNDGHLVRIVGPAFERVCAWARMGIPLKVACRGIDRYCERYYARGPRRRPVRIEHCEADILDLFDAWRRAVGVPAAAVAGAAPAAADAGERRPREGLARHVDRVLAALTQLRAGQPLPEALAAAVDAAIHELDARREEWRRARGQARAAALARLEALDAALAAAARRVAAPAVLASARREAEAELDPFRARMPPAAWTAAVDRAVDRTLREHFGLPVVAFG
jgi:hypothetical protein